MWSTVNSPQKCQGNSEIRQFKSQEIFRRRLVILLVNHSSKGLMISRSSIPLKSSLFLVASFKLFKRTVAAMTESASLIVDLLFNSIALSEMFSSTGKTCAVLIRRWHFSKPSRVCLSQPRNSIFVRIEMWSACCVRRRVRKDVAIYEPFV